MRNKYIQIIIMIIAISLVTVIVLKIKISKINDISSNSKKDISIEKSD